MNQPSKKTTLLTLLALSLAVSTPTIYAIQDPTQIEETPVTMTKLTDDDVNNIDIAVEILGGVLIVVALAAAVYAVKKALKP